MNITVNMVVLYSKVAQIYNDIHYTNTAGDSIGIYILDSDLVW